MPPVLVEHRIGRAVMSSETVAIEIVIMGKNTSACDFGARTMRCCERGGRMAQKIKKGFNCELWSDRILKENKYFPNREGRKRNILDRRNSLCKGKEGKSL